MNDLTPVFVVGILVWGTYKLFELFVRRKERIMIIEKLVEHNVKDETIKFPSVDMSKDTWTLKFALLLMGFGIGSVCAFFTVLLCENDQTHYSDVRSLYFAFITVFGGLGLLISYLIESKQSKNKK